MDPSFDYIPDIAFNFLKIIIPQVVYWYVVHKI